MYMALVCWVCIVNLIRAAFRWYRISAYPSRLVVSRDEGVILTGFRADYAAQARALLWLVRLRRTAARQRRIDYLDG